MNKISSQDDYYLEAGRLLDLNKFAFRMFIQDRSCIRDTKVLWWEWIEFFYQEILYLEQIQWILELMYDIFGYFEYHPEWLSGLRRQSGNQRSQVRIQVNPNPKFCHFHPKFQISSADFTPSAHSDFAHFVTH